MPQTSFSFRGSAGVYKARGVPPAARGPTNAPSSNSYRRFMNIAEHNVAVAARGRSPASRHCSHSTKQMSVFFKTAAGMR